MIAMILALVLAAPVTIRVYPQTLLVGQNVGLTCRVTPHADNRQLKMGFRLWQQSARELEGASAPVTWNFIYQRVPCDTGEPFCEVTRADGQVLTATATMVVAGCEGRGNR